MFAIAWSPDGRYVAAASSLGLWLYESETGDVVRYFPTDAQVWDVAFSPDGALLASGAWDGTIKLWEVESGRELHTLTGHYGNVTSVAFSPDGALLASAAGED